MSKCRVMQYTFTPRAAEKLLSIIHEKGGGLALRIQITRGISGIQWKMTLTPICPEAVVVGGVPVVVDKSSANHLDGMVIDWVLTPAGPGFGVYDQTLTRQDLTQAAD